MRHRLMAAGVALTAALAMVAGSARAATYTVFSCAAPDGHPLPAAGWLLSSYPYRYSTATDQCAAGKGIRLVMAPGVVHPAGDFVDASFAAAPGTWITGYR